MAAFPFFSSRKTLNQAKASDAIAHQRSLEDKRRETQQQYALTHKRNLESRYAEDAMIALDRKAREYIESRSGVPIQKLTDYGGFMSAGQGRVWATFRANHLVASTVSSAKFSVVNRRTGKALDESFEPAKFLVQPNPWDSWEEVLYMLVPHLKMVGTAYLYKDEMDLMGRPKGVYPLLPQYMVIVPDRFNRIKEYIYRINGEEIHLDPETVIQFRRPHPSSFILGLGEVEGGQALFESFINRGLLEEKFFTNGAQPSGILTRKSDNPIDADEFDMVKTKWDKRYGGRANAGKTAFLDGEWNYIRLGLTMQEMEAIEKEKWSIEQIFTLHGIPLSVAGIRDSANYATAKEEARAFRANECVPLLRLITGKLNSNGGLAMPYGNQWRFNFDLSGLVDVEQVMKDYGPLFDRGAMTGNELRLKAGLEKSDDPQLDQYVITNNRIPIEMMGMSAGGPDIEETGKPEEEKPAGPKPAKR